MKHFLTFLKATLLGGVIVVFPAWLAVLLVLKALGHLEIFVKPISKHLPGAIGHPRVIAVVLLVAVCFAVGLLIQTAIGERIKSLVERLVLDKIPGYTTLHGFAARLSDSDEGASFQPALVEIEEALVPLLYRRAAQRQPPFHRLCSLGAHTHGLSRLYHRQQPGSSPRPARGLRDAMHL